MCFDFAEWEHVSTQQLRVVSRSLCVKDVQPEPNMNDLDVLTRFGPENLSETTIPMCPSTARKRSDSWFTEMMENISPRRTGSISTWTD